MSETTRELEPAAAPVAPCPVAPLLVVRAGPAAGRWLRVTGDSATVGNAASDELVLGDRSFGSGRLLLRRSTVGWTLAGDGLGCSGSEALPLALHTGIEWSIGGSSFAWVEAGGMIRGVGGHETPSLRALGHRRLVAGAVAAIAAVAIALCALSFRQPRVPVPRESEAVAKGSLAFEAARAAFLREEWEAVERSAEEARALGVPASEVDRYVDAARSEQRQLERVDEIRRCLAGGDPACARAGLDALAPESVVAERERPRLEAELLRALPAERSAAAPPPARQAEAPRPKRTVGPSAHQTGPALVAKAAKTKAPAARGRTPLAAFGEGDLAGAREAAAAASDPLSRGLAPIFARYDEVLHRGLAAAGPAAFPWLDELVRIEERLGIRSPAGEGARRRLADLHVAAGLAAERAGEWERAMLQFDRATEVSPGHGAASAGRERIRARARETYFEGYALRELDRNKARERFQLVTKLLPSGDETHEKARRWLGTLQAGAAGPLASPARPEAL